MADLRNAAVGAPGTRRLLWTLTVLSLLLLSLVFLHIAYGRTVMSLPEVVSALFNWTEDAGSRHIVWNLRLPRVLIAMAAGAMLGLAGAILQIVLRNPLVEPGLIGVSAGSVLTIVLAVQLLPAASLSGGRLSLLAMLGGMLTVILIYVLNGRKGNSGPRLALTGIVVTSVLQSLTSLLLLKQQQGLASILLWNFGSLNGRVWTHWHTLWPWALALIVLALLLARRAAVLRFSDATAVGLGLPAGRTKLWLLLTAAALTAAAVSVVGAIGFIGLIGPHIAGRLVGGHPLRLFPVSALFSAVLLTAADWMGQSLTLTLALPGLEHRVSSLPVGAVTTLLGAPFFLYLLRHSLVHRRSGGS
ncbi:FecCD family ABC transporter permease [Paenibacillus daejeonensis]|uniref:FecCD family ABC transporter permease n=1 Tax=Paenibacillus daejeonensis TaxID=135193 RepID=UPI0003807EF3|nr:iron ABC transporter permease [Paenibacillus daejeonensis]